MGSVNFPQASSSPVRIGSKLGAAFERMEEKIRERAYQIFQKRAPDEGDSVTDWLDAQMQVLTPINLIVKDQKKNVVVEGNLKGFIPKEIEVEVGANDLKVIGLHTESTTGKKRGATQSSSKTVHFYQAVTLPCEVNKDGSQATLLKNGKLRITLPKVLSG
jgi:HSP20 family molecular chaperone IbpA